MSEDYSEGYQNIKEYDEKEALAAPPCNVVPPVAGCCGNQKRWVRHPVTGRWACIPDSNCPA